MNLIDELRAAAADPPPTRIDLDQLIAGERHRVVRRRWTVAAACAVALAIAGTMAAVRLAVPSPSNDRYGNIAGKLPDFANLKSPEEVWPQAAHRIPGKLPDGRAYQLFAALDDGRYLVRGESPGSPSDLDGPLVFDPARGTARPLFDRALIPGMTEGIAGNLGVVAVGNQAVWLINGVRDGKHIVWEFWAAPLDGSTPARRLVSLSGEQAGGLAMAQFDVAGEAVYWTSPDADGQSAGIVRLPLSGGPPQLIPGSAGYFDTQVDQWVSTQDQLSSARAGTLWNLVTGERRSWTTSPRAHEVTCDPVACYGRTQDRTVVTHQLDGTGDQELPSLVQRVGGIAAEGRFAVGTLVQPSTGSPSLAPLRESVTTFIWDRQTGKAAARPSVAGSGLTSWRADNGEMVVLDLKAIK